MSIENQAEKITAKKNGFIELCRFIFMMSVVSHHSMFLSDDPGYIPVWGGYISVEFFFILTGYLMYSSYQKRRAEGSGEENAIYQIYIKIKRLYPYFLIAWLAIFVMVHGHPHLSSFFGDFLYGIPQLLFLQCAGLSGTAQNYNGTAWFVSALLIGMLVVYLLMYFGKKHFATAIAPLLSLICYGSVMMIDGSFGSVNVWVFCFQSGSLRAIAGLCLGSVCCHIVHSIPQHTLTKLGDFIISLLQLTIVAVCLLLMSRTYGYTDIVQVMLFSFLIIVSFSEKTALNRICNARVFFVLGRASMIIFVTQNVAYCRPDLLPYPENWTWRYLVYIFYVMLFSLLNYLIVENIRRRHIAQNLIRCLKERIL